MSLLARKLRPEHLIPAALLLPVISSAQTMADIIKTTWNELIRPAIIFMFVLATVVFIWGLIQFINNADDEEGRNTGKRHLLWGIIGMAIMVSAGAIIIVIQNFVQSIPN
jgi:uncharacterized membrane protein YidH (DUF202 family)